MGGSVPRLRAEDPELPSLLRAPVPLVVTDSGLAGQASASKKAFLSSEATEKWNFDYLERQPKSLEISSLY